MPNEFLQRGDDLRPVRGQREMTCVESSSATILPTSAAPDAVIPFLARQPCERREVLAQRAELLLGQLFDVDQVRLKAAPTDDRVADDISTFRSSR